MDIGYVYWVELCELLSVAKVIWKWSDQKLDGLQMGSPSQLDSQSPSAIAHHGEIVEGGIVDVSIDIIAVKSGVVHHPSNQKGSVASTAVDTSKRTLLVKIMTDMIWSQKAPLRQSQGICWGLSTHWQRPTSENSCCNISFNKNVKC